MLTCIETLLIVFFNDVQGLPFWTTLFFKKILASRPLHQAHISRHWPCLSRIRASRMCTSHRPSQLQTWYKREPLRKSGRVVCGLHPDAQSFEGEKKWTGGGPHLPGEKGVMSGSTILYSIRPEKVPIWGGNPKKSHHKIEFVFMNLALPEWERESVRGEERGGGGGGVAGGESEYECTRDVGGRDPSTKEQWKISNSSSR